MNKFIRYIMNKDKDYLVYGKFTDKDKKEIRFINDDTNNQLIFEELEVTAKGEKFDKKN